MVPAVILTWIPVVLLLDRDASLGQQRLLGVGTWLLLLALLSREDNRTRVQVAVVVAFATAVEYCFAGWLGVYIYRLHEHGFNAVPWFVPPGHGLVYLGALAIGRSPYVVRHRRPFVTTTVVVAAGYAFWGLAISARHDVLGAFWFGCLVAFLLWRNRQPQNVTPSATPGALVFVGAFVVVTYLELLGTGIGTWTWQARDPILGIVSIGNPPSGAAGGYGFFDAAALSLTPRLLQWLGSARRKQREGVVVQQPVAAHHAAATGSADA